MNYKNSKNTLMDIYDSSIIFFNFKKLIKIRPCLEPVSLFVLHARQITNLVSHISICRVPNEKKNVSFAHKINQL